MMLRVLRVKPASDTQGIAIDDVDAFVSAYNHPFMLGEPLAHVWREWSCYYLGLSNRRSDFFSFNAGTFAFTARVAEQFRDLFESVGEVLPIRVKKERYYVLNILKRVDVIDPLRAEFRKTEEGRIYGVTKFAFLPARLTGLTIFHIIQESGPILTVSGQEDPQLDFDARYQALKLGGLQFRPLWSEG